MTNIPRSRIADIKKILPGINGPTIIDVMNGGDTVAAHAVVPQADVYRVIARLRESGATGILVTRIERLMP
jgi:ATP phosphoribosyltransferase